MESLIVLSKEFLYMRKSHIGKCKQDLKLIQDCKDCKTKLQLVCLMVPSCILKKCKNKSACIFDREERGSIEREKCCCCSSSC